MSRGYEGIIWVEACARQVRKIEPGTRENLAESEPGRDTKRHDLIVILFVL